MATKAVAAGTFVASSPSWSDTLGSLSGSTLTERGREYTCYSPPKAGSQLVLHCCIDIVANSLEEIATTALGQSTKKAAGLFRVLVQSSLEHFSAQYDLPREEENRKAAKLNTKLVQLAAVTGLSEKEYVQCIGLAKTFASDFFATRFAELGGNPIFTYGVNSQELQEWKKAKIVEMHNFAYEKLSNRLHQQTVDFSQADLDAFGIADKGEVTADPKQMTCVAYALLQARAPEAKGIIFKAEGGDAPLLEILNLLPRWGYQSVDLPQEGDLIVYLYNGTPAHVGCATGSGLVLSKLGVNNPSSHFHKPFNVPVFYGNKILFFRRSPSKDV